MPFTSELLAIIGRQHMEALCREMRGFVHEMNEFEIEANHAARYYGYDPYNSSGPNTMRRHWIPCRALDERISLANELQLTPHRYW